ncbi:MAG: formylglycine-generating enzyme family protein [Lentisphaerae bacterium]|nr:formylglycine-generating enzyme family protein [Lentisphaerota bacterium]
MTKRESLNGKPYAGNLHVRFDEGEAASTATSRRGALLYKMKVILLSALATSLAFGANETSITIDSVEQRWPWNNKFDITYTIVNGQDVAHNVFCRLVFKANIDGKEYVIDGVHDIGASANSGTHTITWTPPDTLRVKSTKCTMTAQLLSAENPSGDDYMIVDLDTGKIAYEGLLASQEASNARYNTATYKTDKMVFRRIPKWADRASLPNSASLPSAGYPTGDNINTKTRNRETNWKTKYDYYIGVFPVTQSQYAKIGSDTLATHYSRKTTPIEGNEVGHRPAEYMSWNDLRVEGTAPTSSIPVVATADTGTFFQRLNYKTGNKFGFDLPTWLMFEIAARGGVSAMYPWGDTSYIEANVLKYVVCKKTPETANGSSTVAVGTLLPNSWGLYDTIGNVGEWCLDDNSRGNQADAEDPFTPACGATDAEGTDKRWNSIGSFSNAPNYNGFHVSVNNSYVPTYVYFQPGFRVAFIMK